MRRKALPPSFYNATTFIGFTFALVMLLMILALIVMDALTKSSNSYLGLITYIALPIAMLFGLLVGGVGVLRQRKRLHRGETEAAYPVLNLNVPRHRYAATVVGVGGLLLMALSGFGSYHAYEYTESVQFCGTTCHTIMEPEYVAFQNSPHAKVSCAECHIGNGSESYLKSKVSGTQQLYAMLTNSYTKPVASPVLNLRPSKETCEECHWPKQFYSQKMETHNYFLADDTNTPYQVSMLVKVGSTAPGQDGGIHAHMYLNHQVNYISTDKQRQVIPYVEMTGPDGKKIVYRDKEKPGTDAELAKGERRLVDCIDCHNRPTHIFSAPDTSINRAMSAGKIDPTLPEFKTTATDLLEKGYKTASEGSEAISSGIKNFYKDKHPEFKNQKSIEASISELQDIFAKNYFPAMKTDWKAHPDNLDHLHFSGCFRCHDDKHVSNDGRVISKNCQTCHTIVSQGQPGKQVTALQGQEFKHPVDIGDSWKTTPCKDCHGADKDK